MQKFTAIVKKRVTARTPALNTSGKQILLGPDGKELPKNEKREYVGEGTPKWEEIKTDSTDNPLTDEIGNVIEAATAETLLQKVKEHFSREEHENVEIQTVTVQVTTTVKVVSGEELSKL